LGKNATTADAALQISEQAAPTPRAPGSTQGRVRNRVVRGQIDMTSCDQIRTLSLKCAKAIGENHRSVVIDLGQVEFVDTKLIACLVTIYQLALSSSVRLELRPSEAVLELARFCRLEWLIERTAASDRA
jgi:anti-anti-sigma factor